MLTMLVVLCATVALLSPGRLFAAQGVSWNYGADPGLAGFYVQRCAIPEGGTTCTPTTDVPGMPLPKTARSFTDTVDAGYCWTVYAADSHGTRSPAGLTPTGAPYTCLPKTSGAILPPAGPITLSPEPTGLRVTWLPPTFDATTVKPETLVDFQVWWRPDPGTTWTSIGVVPPLTPLPQPVLLPIRQGRYVRLKALSSIDAQYASIAELQVLADDPTLPMGVIPQAQLKVTSVDSFEPGWPGANAIDGNAATAWHTPWTASRPPLPHEIQVDTGKERALAGITMLPRGGRDQSGRIKGYELSTSLDGTTWSTPVPGSFMMTDLTLLHTGAQQGGNCYQIRARYGTLGYAENSTVCAPFAAPALSAPQNLRLTPAPVPPAPAKTSRHRRS